MFDQTISVKWTLHALVFLAFWIIFYLYRQDDGGLRESELMQMCKIADSVQKISSLDTSIRAVDVRIASLLSGQSDLKETLLNCKGKLDQRKKQLEALVAK